MTDTASSPGAPLFVGGHLALDFINTRYGVGSAQQDWFVDDESVLAWLRLAGVLDDASDDAMGTPPPGLLDLALALRDNMAALVAAARRGEATEPVEAVEADVVNHVLAVGRGTEALQWDEAAGAYRITTTRPSNDPAGLLQPVARALVTLLTKTPIALVKTCEAHDCTLMFRDLTKSHRRRWCSMAVCGNRMKVAAFRQRQRGE